MLYYSFIHTTKRTRINHNQSKTISIVYYPKSIYIYRNPNHTSLFAVYQRDFPNKSSWKFVYNLLFPIPNVKVAVQHLYNPDPNIKELATAITLDQIKEIKKG
jgi:hypothetical protein